MNIRIKDTALTFIDNPNSINFGLPEDIKGRDKIEMKNFGYSFATSFKDIAHAFKDNIRYISDTFMEAYKKARPKLVDIIIEKRIDETGTIITKDKGCTITHFYSVTTRNEGTEDWGYDIFYARFVKTPNLTHLCMDVFVTEANGVRKTLFAKGYEKAASGGISSFETELFGLLSFLRVCEIETKVVQPGKRQRHVGHRYENETKHKIELVDSTWFTTIVRSEGFMVGDETGGFFNLYHTGPGRTIPRLKWVLPFEKHGYTRKAKVLNHK